MATEVFLTIGKVRKPVVLESKTVEGQDRIFLKYPWWPELNAEIKAAFGKYKWDQLKDKRWSIEDSHHNQFRLKFMMGHDPYAPYDKKIPTFEDPNEVTPFEFTRNLFRHQKQGVAHILTRRHCIVAAEPGTGKSLMAIEASEKLYQPGDIAIWVAPKTALLSVKMEAIKWKCKVPFEFLTYEGFVAKMAAWPSDKPIPKILILDEASRVKNETTERAKACKAVADKMRETWGYDSLIVAMSGTPAPQSPVDWHSLVQITCPGFLREADEWRFKSRLCLIKMMESNNGGTFPKVVTWYDNPKKCKVCGLEENDITHTMKEHPDVHAFVPTKNEIHELYNRLKGLVLVIQKKDCLDLPDKHFIRLEAKIPRSLMRAAQLLPSRVGKGAKLLTLLRELSDGFQYQSVEDGETTCDCCEGQKSIADMVYTGPEVTNDFLRSIGVDPEISQIVDPVLFPQYWKEEWTPCCKCKGTGMMARMVTKPEFVASPKDELYTELLEQYEDVGRFVVYGAFQGTIDRLVKLTEKKGWDWIKADGRNWKSSMGGNPMSWLTDFQNPNSPNRKVVFIGQPEAAGMGITLTRSPVVCFYSNSPNGESRSQAIERVHRISSKDHQHNVMGRSLKGVLVIDLIGLPVDSHFLTLLENKRNLESITLGELEESLKSAQDRVE